VPLMEDHVKYLDEHSKKMIESGTLTDEMLRFYRELYAYQRALFEELMRDSRLPEIKRSQLPISRHAEDVLSSGDISALLAGGLATLIDILNVYSPGLDLRELSRTLAEDPGAVVKAIEAILNTDAQRLGQFAASNKTGMEEAVFVIINWLKPFFAALREKNGERIDDSDDSYLCPFCGYHADMAAIVAGMDGKRFLYCSLCGHRWQYRRIACAVCGVQDAHNLEHLSSEDESRYRIDVCNSCGGYVKTVRLAKFEEIDECDLAVENVLTPHLDSAAMQKGYKRP